MDQQEEDGPERPETGCKVWRIIKGIRKKIQRIIVRIKKILNKRMGINGIDMRTGHVAVELPVRL